MLFKMYWLHQFPFSLIAIMAVQMGEKMKAYFITLYQIISYFHYYFKMGDVYEAWAMMSKEALSTSFRCSVFEQDEDLDLFEYFSIELCNFFAAKVVNVEY